MSWVLGLNGDLPTFTLYIIYSQSNGGLDYGACAVSPTMTSKAYIAIRGPICS